MSSDNETRPVLWTAAEAARATGGAAAGRWAATGIAIDNRKVEPGDLFIALRGHRLDGHDFAKAAIDAGAAAVMIDHDVEDLPVDAPCLRVGDTMTALTALGDAGRSRTSARCVAITGSVGKTGTKELTALALSTAGGTSASAASYNNHWGVPISLARLPAAARFGVFEVGMNHPGEITPLAQAVRPHVAVVTKVAAVHLEFFTNVAAIADEKACIYKGLEPGGAALVPADDDHAARLEAAALAVGARVHRFGQGADCFARLKDYRPGGPADPAGGLVEAEIDGTAVRYMMGLPGAHWATNSLAALAAAHIASDGTLDLEAAAAALESLQPLAGRGKRHQIPVTGGMITLIDESYNASPVAVAAALKTLGQQTTGPNGRRIAVLGDMRELGSTGPQLHNHLADTIVAEGIDLVFTTGPMMSDMRGALPASRRASHAPDASALAPLVTASIRPGDVVLVKGSLSMDMAQVVKALLGEPTRYQGARQQAAADL